MVLHPRIVSLMAFALTSGLNNFWLRSQQGFVHCGWLDLQRSSFLHYVFFRDLAHRIAVCSDGVEDIAIYRVLRQRVRYFVVSASPKMSHGHLPSRWPMRA